MPTKCKNCPLRRRDLFEDLTDDEVAYMQRFKVGELVVDAGTQLLMQGSNSPQLFTVLSGMGLRYKLLSNGKRQVLNLIMPGDFIGLQAGLLSEMGHSVEATTRMTLCVFDRASVWSLFKDQPHRAFDVTWLAAIEEHFLGDALSALGQRSALQAMAWAFTRIFLRGEALGLVENRRMRFPYKQQDIAHALGLSLVHTNKTLATLRGRQLAQWSDGVLQVTDIEELAEVGLVDDLDVRKRPII